MNINAKKLAKFLETELKDFDGTSDMVCDQSGCIYEGKDAKGRTRQVIITLTREEYEFMDEVDGNAAGIIED